ncbi:putative transcription factor B3-Domain family [Medicago truncatula]|uniref:Putative transcription factor B3-Domain family n=1 Tax=Medicago truncatula TaxID=3880 RepID=A0A396IQ70_MEDTR|nr:putative transcription factor B3-Domain family [Medicago truncatula]
MMFKQIPNNFTRRYGVGLTNPVLIKAPDGTKWKVYWKKINGEIWFEKGWKHFTENYSLQHGCLVVFKYKGTSKFDVLILGNNAVEIDYDSSCDTDDENGNVGQNDDESLEISDEWRNQKIARKRPPLFYPRPHKKFSGENKKSTKRTSSLNRSNRARVEEVAAKFTSSNPFFTILILPNHLVAGRPRVPNIHLKGVIENKEKNLVLQIGERSWKVKLLASYERETGRRLSAGWSLFVNESGLQPENVCVFELINKENLVFKVHVF